MNQEAQDKLRVLRQRLADLEPYPWELTDAWIASATPLIKAHYAEHFKEFKAVTTAPNWCVLARWSSGGGRWDDGPRRDNFAEAARTEDREDRKRAAAARDKILAFVDGLLDLPPLPAQPPAASPGVSRDQPAAYYHQGDVIMSGAKYTSTITGSTVGAVAVGDHAQATGMVNSQQGPLTQAQHLEHIKTAKKALIDDEDQLGELVYEALGQFLRLAREIQVEQRQLAEVQVKMKATLDEVWAQQEAKGLRPRALPEGLKIVEALANNPIMAEVAKYLLAGK